ncbi:poly-gamma-glutamate synthesis protein (capsule biosynthesis protein) [Butyrivibrio fibrisolvens DSM 3071]|uniref:Poly-gamma-glutamate synthesis protein (Capsule biosynthesis protein) n=1 Tax=Butyrivibrio fibrisolvens DSM 3071 TaxID=1121131 RepID=A0A1M5QDG8_BUTFI|nr:CapA family protein [Butyrivibrio fibrisolvens]SHH12195.1 poly-gamma-glutamate synthesis protein (capsule biosynthesis protein) [Butyrivibrio fibrisolvens DSM 3071]
MLKDKKVKRIVERFSSSLMLTSIAFLCMSCAYNSERIDPSCGYAYSYNSTDSYISEDDTPMYSQVSGDSLPGTAISAKVIDHSDKYTSSISSFTNNIDRSVLEERLPKTVTVMMVGDILLHMPIEETCHQDDGSYDFSSLFANTSDIISSADLSLVNQEVIIGGEELGISGYPCFNAPYQIADALADSGFDIICHATNHALDKGTKGIINTLNYWNTAHPEIITLGIYDNEEDSKDITVVTVNDIKIAILNYTYGTNGIPIPKSMPYCVETLNEDSVIADLDLAEEIADFTIVCPHWGTEYVLHHTSNQEYWSKLFMEHGADLVIGTHPHVIEDIEYYHDDDHDMLCYYSIGNFVSWTSSSGKGVLNRVVGGIANVTIRKDYDGKVYIETYDIIPTVCHLEPVTNGVSVYPLELYTEELALQNKISKQDSSFTLDNCNALVQDVWGESCEMKLPETE